MEIKFTTGDSPLGNVLVAATDKGVCTVSLRESEEGAEDTLRARFPRAEIRRDDAALEPALDSVLARIAGRRLDDALPLDLKATRAVAQACGANPVAVVVPCHRVVMSDGSIGGYSGLPGVKRALLAAEGVELAGAAG